MNILILGAAGMIGRKLFARLVAEGSVAGQAITGFTLVDVVAPPVPPSVNAKALTADLTVAGTAEQLISEKPDLIFHLAGVVSGEAEKNFEKGYAVNLDGGRALFEAIRREHEMSGYRPRVIFTSSVAVFGAPLPDMIGEDQVLTPLTSYGTQKAIVELLLSDYTRRGYFDGIGIRLPTICIRPGAPNAAASGFFSNILREPLIGLPAILPVPETLRHWFASPRAAIAYLMHAANLDSAAIGPRRNLNMPGLSATVADAIEALRKIAGDKAVGLIRREPDAAVTAMISAWARDFDASRALALGFEGEGSFEDIIRIYIEDELDDVSQMRCKRVP
jgi:nucleoside-diphosphate-sugar epimerase